MRALNRPIADRSQWLLLGLFCCGISMAANTASYAADWPQFLGPDRNGISSETGLISAWPTDGPPVVWRQACGEGMSGVAISQGRVYSLYQDGQRQYVLCLNAGNGEKIWATPIADNYRNQMGHGPRATPAIADGAVYALTGDGILAAVDAKSGKMLWAKDCPAELKGRIAEYGMACSPLVVGDQVVVTVGAGAATVCAFDKQTGDLKWTSGRGDAAGYSSPALLKVGGRSQLVVFHGGGAVGLQPATGTELWRHPFQTDYDCNIATPIAMDGKVLISAGENHGTVLLDVASAQSGRPKSAWDSLGTGSVMRCEWQTPVLLDEFLYGLDNVGSAGPVTNLVCVNARTGQQVWIERRFGKGNLIAADGKLFATTMKGELVVVEATTAGYNEIGRKMYIGRTRQAPALANGRLFLRDDKEIVCIDVRQPKSLNSAR